jgi:hypothetical protein
VRKLGNAKWVINPAVIDFNVKIKTFKVFKIKFFFGDRGSAPVTPPC